MLTVSIVGARPQFIKAAMVSRELHNRPGVRDILVHTGQHYDDNMSAVFFREMGLPLPDYQLEIGSGTHGQQTGRMIEAIEKVLLVTHPNWVLVYGDTNSTLAGAIAASKLHLALAHVEAGLRSFNRSMPEEINRVLTDHVSERLYAPTESAAANLIREGLPASGIRVVGDVMYDATLFFGKNVAGIGSLATKLNLGARSYLLATIHRAENTDVPARLTTIFRALLQIAQELPVVMPLHPRTRKALLAADLWDQVATRLKIIEPQGYLQMLGLEKDALLIVTDSGGVQKEAFFSRVPCVTLRDETEWTELVASGWNRLVPPHSISAVVSGIRDSLKPPPTLAPEFYGGGVASRLITDDLLKGNS